MANQYGVTENGFVRKPLDKIIESLNQRFIGKFGATFDVSPESPDGQVIGIVADEISTCWQQSEFGFNAYRPGAVSGVGLDNICELTRTKRYVNKHSSVTIVCGGAEGTVVPKGSIASDGNMDFKTLNDVVIPGDVTAEAMQAGEYFVAARSVNQIKTPVSGWTSVINDEEGQTGILYEEDPALRVRRDKTTAVDSATTIEAIYASLADLNLSYIRIRDNDTLAAIGTQPAGTVMVVVDGGTKNDIARRIYRAKTGGVMLFGDISIEVNDSKGYPHTVAFSRSVEYPVYVSGTFKRRMGANISSNDTMKHLTDAAIKYVNGLQAGEPLIWSSLFAPLMNAVQGVEIVDLFIGIAANPTGKATIETDINQRARTTEARTVFTDVTNYRG